MFIKTLYLINKNPFSHETSLKAIITFFNEVKYSEFEKAQNKRHWLTVELNLSEDYFWNSYIEDPDTYINEVDNEYLLDKQLKDADDFVIR
jgi:hypothetical protein